MRLIRNRTARIILAGSEGFESGVPSMGPFGPSYRHIRPNEPKAPPARELRRTLTATSMVRNSPSAGFPNPLGNSSAPGASRKPYLIDQNFTCTDKRGVRGVRIAVGLPKLAPKLWFCDVTTLEFSALNMSKPG